MTTTGRRMRTGAETMIIRTGVALGGSGQCRLRLPRNNLSSPPPSISLFLHALVDSSFLLATTYLDSSPHILLIRRALAVARSILQSFIYFLFNV
jgi:hypothetical protein